MSYILQALRRSEQAQREPEAASTFAPPELIEERRPTLLWVALALTAIAVAGAGGFYLRSVGGGTTRVAAPAAPVLAKRQVVPDAVKPEPAPQPPRQAGAPAEQGGETAAAAPEAPPALKPSPFVEPPKRSEVRDLAEQLRVPPPPPVAKAAPAPRAAPAASPRTALAAPAPATPPAARVDDGIKFLRAMPPEFQRELPPLVVNIHIYSPNEADRILYINNRQYQVGDKVREDVRVEAIVEDGAVLSFRGQRFKLARPS